ncbi:YceI family protein [Mucilaginibacter sp. X5P1]|uniref:YceI family protein n=1 Tax=Mucilaginibacter sp. X5P1 TaxID=2723088 RepID=UPI00161D92CB|nr:YceI family protein [Mucilaginibacter sp. X5P1]MBB6140834.1 polyisoprenoid-binding protein YceI [Mucilaginibacter sp. X5P1]
MKNNIKQALILTAICIIGFNSMLHAQSIYKINDSKDMDMKLSGTSTLHSWTMDAKTFSGDADFHFESGSGGQLSSVKSLTFTLAVADLKGSEGGLNKNAYKALKAKDYKDIDYKLISAIITPEKDNKYLVKTHGNLTIAGVTKEVIMNVECVVNPDATITCIGSERLNMTDYAVKPPTFMLGAMKTGDAITLNFTLVYKKTS